MLAFNTAIKRKTLALGKKKREGLMSVTPPMSLDEEEEEEPYGDCCDLMMVHGHCGWCGGICSESSQICGTSCPGSYLEAAAQE